jgi:polar amino acid transport system substrate-binding protein
MRILKFFFLTVLLFYTSIPSLYSQEIIKIAFPLSPPWRHVTDGKIDGVDGLLMAALAQKLNAKVEFEVLPFKRSVKEIEMGRFDMMSGLLYRPAREEFLHYVKPEYKKRSNKAFFVLKGKGHTIKEYEDLLPMKIGLRMGVKYFPRFDEDKQLQKYAVRENDLNIVKLLKGRIDTFIISRAVGEYLIKDAGHTDRIETAEFGYSKENPVYIGISRKSPWAKRHEEISAIFSEMASSGEIDRLIEGYFTRNGMPVPPYK